MDCCEHGDEPKSATIEIISSLDYRQRKLFRIIN